MACQAVNPARHSSWTSAGIPQRLAATIWACEAARDLAPTLGSTGAVPNGRVSCPSPPAMASAQIGASCDMSSCWGATAAAVDSAPTHRPTS